MKNPTAETAGRQKLNDKERKIFVKILKKGGYQANGNDRAMFYQSLQDIPAQILILDDICEFTFHIFSVNG